MDEDLPVERAGQGSSVERPFHQREGALAVLHSQVNAKQSEGAIAYGKCGASDGHVPVPRKKEGTKVIRPCRCDPSI